MFEGIKNLLASNKDTAEVLDKNDPLVQLKVVYGQEKAKIILKKISDLKKQNPNKQYSFIFDEHGEFVAIEKNFIKGKKGTNHEGR